MVKLQFGIQECNVVFPRKVSNTYVLDYHYCLNYKKNLWSNSKREIIVDVTTPEDKTHFKEVIVKTTHHDLKISTGTISATDILQKIASIYNKLILKLRYTGEIIEVRNLLQIQKKWKDIKAYFEDRYKGKQLQNLIQRIDRIVSCQQLIIEDVLLYEQFSILFKPLYGTYNDSKFNAISQKMITSKGIMIAKEKVALDNITDQVLLKIEGEVLEANNIVEYSGSYSLDKKDEWIKEAEIKIFENNNERTFENSFSMFQKT